MKSFSWIGRAAMSRTASVYSYLATLLLVCACCAPVFAQAAGAAASTAAAQATNIRTLLIFPFDNGAGDAGAASAAQLAGAVKLRINSVGVYQATSFSLHLPAIERAVDVDNTLSPDDVKMPITDPAQGQRIARLAGTDGYVMGSLEGMTTEANGTVRLTVSAEMYSTQTGAAVKTVAITGTAAPSSRSEDPAAVLDRAQQDAAGKVAAALASGASAPQPAVVPATSNGSKHSRMSAGGAVLLVLAAALVAVVASNAGATGGGSSGGGAGASGGSGGGTGGGVGGSGPPAPPFSSSAHHAR